MNRKELIDELAERFEGNRKVAAHALDSVVDVITKSVAAGEKVVISGFGAFERRLRKMGDDAGKYVPEFRPGKELNEVVSGARSMRERVTKSLAVVPAAAAGVAQQAGRVAATGLRAAAGKARGIAESAPIPGTGQQKDQPAKATAAQPTKVPVKRQAATVPAKKQAATKSVVKKQPAAKKSAAPRTAKKTTAKKSAAPATAKKATAKRATAKKSATPRTAKKAATKETSAPRAADDNVSAAKKAAATQTQTPAPDTPAGQPPSS